MSRRFDQYRVGPDDESSDSYFNAVHEDIDLRLHGVEEKASDWDNVVEEFQQLGLQKLEQAMTPIYEQVAGAGDRVAELIQAGTFFSVGSLSAITPGTGEKTFVVNADVRERFSPAYYLTAFKDTDPETFVSGYLISYNRSTGVLTINVDRFAGVSEVASWTITPTVEPTVLQGAYAARDAAITARDLAQGYATQAETAKNQAASAQAAAISASNAASAHVVSAFSYATQAASSRDNAALQAAAASASASNAQQIYVEVSDVASNLLNTYLGQFATDPISGRNGAPLQSGMLYYNTVTNETKVYTGVMWVSLNSTEYLSTGGGTLSGPLILSRDPVDEMEACTKRFTVGTAIALAIALG